MNEFFFATKQSAGERHTALWIEEWNNVNESENNSAKKKRNSPAPTQQKPSCRSGASECEAEVFCSEPCFSRTFNNIGQNFQ